MRVNLHDIVKDFAEAIQAVDSAAPQAQSARSKRRYQPGIGPHTESQTVEMVAAWLAANRGDQYAGRLHTSVPYLGNPKQKCDLCIRTGSQVDWAIEVKMLRLLGDNGKPNDNMLMHILSPYARHRSALTDCEKLAESRLGDSNAMLIYGYESEGLPIATAIDAFEILATQRVQLGPRTGASFDNLIHPVHSRGEVFTWEIHARSSPHAKDTAIPHRSRSR